MQTASSSVDEMRWIPKKNTVGLIKKENKFRVAKLGDKGLNIKLGRLSKYKMLVVHEIKVDGCQ